MMVNRILRDIGNFLSFLFSWVTVFDILDNKNLLSLIIIKTHINALYINING
jgi:hypothetical protein